MSKVIAGMDWQELYSFASKQALLGLCFEGIERLGKEYPVKLKQNPIGRELLMTWMGKAQQIRRQNMKVNAVASKLFSMLREDGLRCCILKGQGNALMYPNPYSRTPGSGDVTAPSRCSEPLRSKDGGASKPLPDCAGWDRRGVSGDTNSVSCSSGSSITSVRSASTTDSSASTALVVVQRELKYLGLWKFAGAVMYVLKEVLGLSEDKMIVPVDEKRGRLLLAEILDGGNFGRHFSKYGGFTHQSMGKKYFLKIWRNMHFVRYYPAEALSEPIFRTWHFFWRVKNKK